MNLSEDEKTVFTLIVESGKSDIGDTGASLDEISKKMGYTQDEFVTIISQLQSRDLVNIKPNMTVANLTKKGMHNKNYIKA